MAVKTDRIGEILEGVKRNSKILLSPEGVPLDIKVAANGERLMAFCLDFFLMIASIVVLYILLVLLFFSSTNISVGMTLVLFLAFIVRNMYFVHFELAWQGRTPGKRLMGLRVINRNGGELTPSAIIARNLTREVEIFLPLSLYMSMGHTDNIWQELSLLGWAVCITMVPLFNKEHLRAGDIIAGTQVISIPKRVLLKDLAVESDERNLAAYKFTHDQLDIYGNFELQVLEELLRRPESPENRKTLREVCDKIRRKINWMEPVPDNMVRRFLTDFYTAERASLERGQLFGRVKEDKTSSSSSGGNGRNSG